jgi:hypothetical protein
MMSALVCRICYAVEVLLASDVHAYLDGDSESNSKQGRLRSRLVSASDCPLAHTWPLTVFSKAVVLSTH